MKTFMAALGVVTMTASADARPSRAISIDGDIGTSDVAMVGSVVGMRVISKSAPGPFNSTVELREYDVRVEVPYGRSSRGQLVRLVHPRVLPSSKPVINGFGPVSIQRGKAYLFFLRARSAGGHELVAVEDRLVEIPSWSFATLRRMRHGKAIDRLVAGLELLVRRCSADCSALIWKLQSSNVRKRHHAAHPKRRRLYVRSLIRLTRSNKHDNTLLSAYTSLGFMGVTRVVPRIVRELTRRPRRGSRRILSNSISWLQGFSEPVQMRALATVVARAKDPGVVRAAQQRLRYLRSRHKRP